MKYRNKETGEVFDSITKAWTAFCSKNLCHKCKFSNFVIHNESCKLWMLDHTDKAAAIMGYEIIPDNPYWRRVTEIADKQRSKGLAEYGQGLESNNAPLLKRLEYLQEELVDALNYIEWIKDVIK